MGVVAALVVESPQATGAVAVGNAMGLTAVLDHGRGLMVAVVVVVMVVVMEARNCKFPFFGGFRTIIFLLLYFREGFWLPYFSCTEFLHRFLRPLVRAR